jgi:hypothetical protein
VQQRLSPTDQPQHRPRARRTAQRVVVLGRLHRDVVAEPLGLLVRVGMAADVDQQRGVVDDRALPVVEPGQLGQPQRDPALPQHVFHRLPEPEVHTQRQGGHQLGQPQRPARRVIDHRAPASS